MDHPLTGVRAIHFASTMMVAGVIFFLVFALEPAFRKVSRASDGLPPSVTSFRTRLMCVAWISLAVALVSGASWLVLQVAGMSGRSWAEAVSGDSVWTVLTQTRLGQVCAARLVLAALLAAALLQLNPQPSPKDGTISGKQGLVASALAACFLGSLGFAGHAGESFGIMGAVHLAADVLHLIAAGVWIGGLLPLALLLAMARRAADNTWSGISHEAAIRFSKLALISVGTLLATGIVQTVFLAGSMPALVGTEYGRLLLMKIGLFISMICIAAVARSHLTPQLSPTQANVDVLHQLRRNSLIEVGLGLAVIVIVGALGSMTPASHVQASWPFPIRYSEEVFNVPELRTTVLIAVAVTAIGILLVIGGVGFRRFRRLLIVAGIVVVAYFAPDLRYLTVKAVPTSFHTSPTGYTAWSIARGADLFTVYCVVCHGREGLGNGVASGDLTVKPANLTSRHTDVHPDGELFWWITNGIGEPMPGFAAILDEDERWSLIDFIRANADSRRLRGLVTSAAFPAPEFSAQCPNGSTVSLRQLQGRIIHLVLAGSRSADLRHQLVELNLGDDVTTIVVPFDTSTVGDMPVCVANDPAAIKAFALYRGNDAGRLERTEYLVDASGSFRSLWYPGIDWNDTDMLKRRIEAIRQVPAQNRIRRSAQQLQ